jgi:hypothetical protein
MDGRSDSQHKEQAEFYRLALREGLCTVLEVIAWCDAIIMAEEFPDVAIIEAAVSGGRGAHVVIDLLADVEGEFEHHCVVRRVFRLMFEVVRRDRAEASNVARVLFQLASSGDAPDEEAEGEMWSFWDAIDLAHEGIVGDEEKLIDEMLQFLEIHSEPEELSG